MFKKIKGFYPETDATLALSPKDSFTSPLRDNDDSGKRERNF
jgi:hypothetical protein